MSNSNAEHEEEDVRKHKREADGLNSDLLGNKEVPDSLQRDPKLDEESRPGTLNKKPSKNKRHT